METLQIQDIEKTHSFFESKEHYLNFIDSWKQYIADGRHKCETYTDGQGGTCKMSSDLTCTHHLFYNALRKRDLTKSFSPLTNENKLNSRYDKRPYALYYDARSEIAYAVRSGNIGDLVEPFGDTVAVDMLTELSETLKDVNL